MSKRTKHTVPVIQKLKTELNAVNGQINMLSSALVSRARLASSLGQHFGGDRNVFSSCGYPTTITFDDYDARFSRQDVAKRIVLAYPDASWVDPPMVYESESPTETEFEKGWAELENNRSLRIFHYLSRIDVISGIGRYGVLLLGFDDSGDWAQPVANAKQLLYLQPYTEANAEVKTWVKDKNDERFGYPELYSIRMNMGGDGTDESKAIDVHWSRVIHVAEGCTESDIYGTPRMEAVYNRLMDLEKIMGGAAEGLWRGGFPAYSFEAEAGTVLQGKAALEDEIENFIHKLTRVLRLQGIKTNVLQHSLQSPETYVQVELWLISAATGIPLRILMGSERGELASSMDERNWAHRVNERCRNYVGPIILTAFIDRLIDVGLLSEPSTGQGYTIEWKDPDALGEKDSAEVGLRRTEALAKYASVPEAQMILPVYYFLTGMLGYDQDEAEAIAAEMAKLEKEEEEQAARDAEDMANNPPPEPDEEDEEEDEEEEESVEA